MIAERPGMLRHLLHALPALVAAGALSAGAAHADRIDLAIQLVRPDGGAPIVGKPVRVVVGGEARPRAPGAGAMLVTDAEGRLRRTVEVPVKTRRVTLDNPFFWHKVRHAAVGVELDIAGRPALYWTEFDLHREGTLGHMIPYLAGPDGQFDRMLEFHSRQHVWSFPGEPDGPRLTGIGAELRAHRMEGGDGVWTIDLVIEKHEFQWR
jgi:hypothetical protein